MARTVARCGRVTAVQPRPGGAEQSLLPSVRGGRRHPPDQAFDRRSDGAPTGGQPRSAASSRAWPVWEGAGTRHLGRADVCARREFGLYTFF